MNRVRQLISRLYFEHYLKGGTAYRKLKTLYGQAPALAEQEHLKLLNATLAWAQQKIPFYQKLVPLKASSANDLFQVEKLTDIEEWPILDKEIIRSVGTNMYLPEHRQYGSFINTSGGSTGQPLRILQDKQYSQYAAGQWAFIKAIRTGNPFSHAARLWGATRDLYGSRNTWKGRLVNLVDNSISFNAARLTPADIHTFIQYINRYKPSVIVAYAQAAYEVARFAQQEGITISPQQAIHTGAGQLLPFMRIAIEEVFQAPVYNHYGAREVGAIATECQAHDGLHILNGVVHVEVVDEAGKACLPGQEGDVLITTLRNQVMPLIRYRIGDRAVAGNDEICSCGIITPRLTRIAGRTVNNFKLEKGGFVSGEYLTLTFNHVPGVVSFQIRQKAYTHIDVYIVITNAYQATGTEQRISSKLQKLLGATTVVHFHYVEHIPLTSTGKHLFTICEI